MEVESKRYDMVNVLRLVCAYFVIAVHIVAFFVFGNEVRAFMSDFVFRIAVPFFFITSGYFFYSKYEVKGYFKKYIKKLLFVFIICDILDTIAMVIVVPPEYFTSMTKGILFKQVVINGTHNSLWYFPALIMSSIFVYAFLKKGALKPLSILSIVLYIIAFLGDTWYGLIANTPFVHVINGYEYLFDTTRNGITFGVPLFTLGALINKYKINEKVKNTLVLNIAAWVIYGIEAYIIMHSGIAKDYNIYFTLPLVGSAVFIYALNSKVTLTKNVSNYLRNMSLWVYALHGFIILTCSILGILNAEMNTMLMFLIICVISTIVAYIISFIKFRKKSE